jgi:cation diffusion facilitator CzcD-associated flavoprotein CzcO
VAEHVDILIVGAGISGIDSAYHVQTKLPGRTYAILEARDTIGGTWDLFRYPGVRSDSDMYTLGFPFRPWTSDNSISDGATILQYVKDTAREFGIDKHIRYGKRVVRARWNGLWSVDLADGTQMTCNFIHLCTGYYHYDDAYTPDFPGRAEFRGRVVHPQFWPDDLDYAGKRVVVIGSGATAVTLVPELAKRAAHVTMLQRSPTYIVSVPARDRIAIGLRKWMTPSRAHNTTRWKNVLFGMAFYAYSRRYPAHAKRFLVNQVKKHLGDTPEVRKHFTPSYNVWDQRLCLVPDADLFAAIKSGAASIVTDHIDAFTATGIRLKSGAHLDADLIVTATGLKLRVFGGIEMIVDGVKVEPAKTIIYLGLMVSGVPNLAFSVGYTNASWTLKCDLTSRYICRLIAHMDRRGYTECRPERDPSVEEIPLIDFNSGYVQRAIAEFPRQGATLPWRVYQNYVRDLRLIEKAPIEDRALRFTTATRSSQPSTARASRSP